MCVEPLALLGVNVVVRGVVLTPTAEAMPRALHGCSTLVLEAPVVLHREKVVIIGGRKEKEGGERR